MNPYRVNEFCDIELDGQGNGYICIFVLCRDGSCFGSWLSAQAVL